MLRWLGVLMIAAALAGILAAAPSGPSGPPRLSRGPYLQLASETGITIRWDTTRPARGRVDYGAESYTDSKAGAAGTTRHAVRLEGLAPGRRYRYRVVADGRVLRDGLHFTTSKPPGSPFRFAVFGDSGSGDGAQAGLAARIAAASPDFLVHTGDLVYPRGAQKDYDPRFFRPYAALLARAPFWPTPGNHDVASGGRAYLENFSLPRNGPGGVTPERSYSFDYADAHFAAVDSNLGDDTLRSKVAPWLRRDLAASRRTWKFVFLHHPPYSSGLHGESARIQRLLVPTLRESGVDVVFNGHDHAYERTHPLRGVVYVVTGAGGNGLYRREHTHAYTARFDNRSYSFTLAEGAGIRLRLRQIAADGRVIDDVELRKKPAGQ